MEGPRLDFQIMSKSVSIRLEDVSLRFRIYRNPSPGLKEQLTGLFNNRADMRSRTQFDALKNINLDIKSGERLGVIGLNGAGKSTLLKTIVGIYPSDRGIVHVQGQVTPFIELGAGFDMDLSGRENIYLNGTLLGRSFRQMRSLEKDIIEFSELEDFIDLQLKYYSSGMVSRLAFSVATAVPTEILLLDEIFSVGDKHFVSKARQKMTDILGDSQIVVYVSHDLETVKQMCTRVIVLHKGEMVADAKPEDAIDFYLRRIVGQDMSAAGVAVTQDHGSQTASV